MLSYAAGVKTAPWDEFVIEADTCGKPPRNRMEAVPDEGLIEVAEFQISRG